MIEKGSNWSHSTWGQLGFQSVAQFTGTWCQGQGFDPHVGQFAACFLNRLCGKRAVTGKCRLLRGLVNRWVVGENLASLLEKQSLCHTVFFFFFTSGQNAPLKMWACYSTSLHLCFLICRMEIRFAPFLPHQDLWRLDNGCKVLIQRYTHYHKQRD